MIRIGILIGQRRYPSDSTDEFLATFLWLNVLFLNHLIEILREAHEVL